MDRHTHSAQFAYEHYRIHIDTGRNLLEQLLQLIVNVLVATTSLAQLVRQDLKSHGFPWFRASLLGGPLANVNELRAYYERTNGFVRTLVDPMRTKKRAVTRGGPLVHCKPGTFRFRGICVPSADPATMPGL
eukprot:8112874-Pyramimonas_sp.AAC.2